MNRTAQLLAGILAAFVAAASLRAQALPPPVAPGQVDITAEKLGEVWQSSYEYEPPTLLAYYSIWAEKIGVSRQPYSITEKIASNGNSALPGETITTFTFDPSYAANHPEVIKPAGFYISAGSSEVVIYSTVTLKHTWDNQGQLSFALTSREVHTGREQFIRGFGSGLMFWADSARSFPVTFVSNKVTQASAGIKWFRYYPPSIDYRYMEGTAYYFTKTQPDGSEAVFHVNYYTPVGSVREYFPIGVVTTTGTPGHAASPPGLYFSVRTNPLSPESTEFNLRGESNARSFDDANYQLTTEPAAHYAFSPEGASASKLRYKLGIQSGLARTITWVETFTPDGATEPTDYAFMSEAVTAEATETQPHIIDPFAPGHPHRFGSQPGKYEILIFDGALSVDTNRDGSIMSPVSPITPPRIANADQGALGADLQFRPNQNDDVDGNAPAETSGGPDCLNNRVDGIADLQNFIPVYLDIGQFLSRLPPDNGFTYKLKQADEALNLVYTNLTQATAFDYLSNPESGFGPDLDRAASTAPTIQIKAVGTDIFEGETGSGSFRDLCVRNSGGVILIEARRGSAQPLVLEISRNGAVVIAIQLPLFVFEASLAVDANRDGTIKYASEDASDTTTADKPYRFWLNDDIDRTHITNNSMFHTANEQDDLEISPTGKVDWQENQIPCSRDLEDFARLWISTPGLTAAFQPKDGTDQAEADLYIGLQWATNGKTGAPAIKIYPAFEADGGNQYLNVPAVADQQVNFDYAVKDFRDTATPDIALNNVAAGTDFFIIPPRYFARLSDAQPKTFFLFEGVSAGNGLLKLVILKKENGTFTKIGDGPGAWFDLQNIRNHYQSWTVGDNTSPGVHADVIPALTHSAVSGSPTLSAPATEEEKDFILFVHGWNMTTFEKDRFAETAFKRLWWQGYKGRFGAFRWPTYYTNPDDPYGIGPPLHPLNFDGSEYNSWRSAEGLLKLLTELKITYHTDDGYSRVRVLAHSHGNLAVSEALLCAVTPIVHTYIASQAAIAAHCFDGDLTRVPDISSIWDNTDIYRYIFQHPDAITPQLQPLAGRALAVITPNVYSYYPGNAGLDSNLQYPTAGQPYMTGAIGSQKWVNYFNQNDWALDGWITDQALKPDIFYHYRDNPGDESITPIANGWWFYYQIAELLPTRLLSIPEDTYEIFSFAAQARSQPLGRQPGVMGLFNGRQVSWDAYGDKHPGHSAEFRSSIAQRGEYWQQLLISFALKAAP